MSAIRRYPRVENTLTAVRSQEQSVCFSSKVLQVGVQTLSSKAQAVYRQVAHSLTNSPPTIVQSTAYTRQRAQVLQQQVRQIAQESRLPVGEAEKVAGLVAAGAYVTAEPQSLPQAWQQLQNAGSIESAKTAHANLLQQLERNHQQVVVDNLVLACTNAALKVGFQPLKSIATVVNGKIRLIASDDTGLSLVTEIATNPDAPVPMAMEIIGSSDASCEEILDAFEVALKAEGVTTAPPERKFTGGVCELEAARDFVRQRPTPKSTQAKKKSRTKKVPRSSAPQQQMRQG